MFCYGNIQFLGTKTWTSFQGETFFCLPHISNWGVHAHTLTPFIHQGLKSQDSNLSAKTIERGWSLGYSLVLGRAGERQKLIGETLSRCSELWIWLV